MDNNDFFNNDGNDELQKDTQNDDIFAEETVEDESDDNDKASRDSGEQNYGQQDNAQQNQNAGQQNNPQWNQNAGQQSWNQNRVNPDQWQAYRNSQQGGSQYGQGNQQNGQWYGQGNQQNGPQYQQNPYQNYGYNGYYQPDNSRGFGIASMVLGIISLLCFCSFLNLLPAVLAIVFGIISLSRRKGNGFAIAGIVCGAISVALLIITCVLFAANADLMNAFRDYMNQYSGNGFNYFYGN